MRNCLSNKEKDEFLLNTGWINGNDCLHNNEWNMSKTINLMHTAFNELKQIELKLILCHPFKSLSFSQNQKMGISKRKIPKSKMQKNKK